MAGQRYKFLEAVKTGRVGKVADLLTKLPADDLDCTDSDGKSALFHAVTTQDARLLQLLLASKVNPDQMSHVSYHRDHQLYSFEEPALVTAARLGNYNLVSLLLQAGANPDSQCQLHKRDNGLAHDKTALHFACEEMNVELVRLLLDYNADVNIEDWNDELPIHKTVRCRNCAKQTEILKLLCEHGTDVDKVNKIGCSSLYLATFYGCIQKVEILLLYAADVNCYLERENSYGTPLHIAAAKDRPAIAQLLLTYGAKINIANAQQCTPLHLNVNCQSRSEVAPMLIRHGAEINGIDKWNSTLLGACMVTTRLDCETLAKLIVASGYDLNQDAWLKSGENMINMELSSEMSTSVPIPEGRMSKLCEWLRNSQKNTQPLLYICRNTIRRKLSLATEGRSIYPSVSKLPLPTMLKQYLLFSDY